tara:strand:+ start:49 stop:483 length:435 start_codon:yes stop_codon:yes gene_type:complete
VSIDYEAEKARLAAKKKEKKIESLGEIEVVGVTPKTNILRSTRKRVGGTDRVPIYKKVAGKGRAVGRMKQVGGTARAPIYKKVKNYDDYTEKEFDKMTDDDYVKMEKASTIQYRNPKYKVKKNTSGSSRFSEGGMIVSSLYESF